MEEIPVPDQPPRQQEVVAAAVEAPAMPNPPPDTLRRYAYLIPGKPSPRYGLGWQDTRKDGPCFIVLRYGAMADKVLDRFPLTADGWAQAWAALVKLDADTASAVARTLQERSGAAAAREAEIASRALVYEAFANAREAPVFKLLSVQVLVGDGKVYTIGLHDAATKTNTSQVLGPLAGAEAMVTDGAQAWSPGRAMFLPIGFAGLATKTKADAAVVFPDGTAHITPLDGNYAVREAQKQVVQFNALAGAATPVAKETGIDHAARLRKLQELRDVGLLSQEEYEAKRAEVIDSI